MNILIDCTASYWRPHNQTGIQRFVRELCARAATCAPVGRTCIPVQWSMGSWRRADTGSLHRAYARLRHAIKAIQRAKVARRLAARRGEWWNWAALPAILLAYATLRTLAELMGVAVALACRRMEPAPSDTLLLPEFPYRNRSAIAAAKRGGTRIVPVIHDLHPLTHPHVVGEGEKMREWLRWCAQSADRILCVSAFVAGEVRRVLGVRETPVDHFHHGADFSAGRATAEPDLPSCYFLMVGSLAPNKRHADALDAFDLLWSGGCEAGLVIVGRPGWMTDHVVARLRAHPELGRRLRWLDDADDVTLAAAYRRAHALIAASEIEGFGLPVIEALLRGTPVLASDIPVFREVAGDWADYFAMGDPRSLAELVKGAASRPRRDVSGFRWHSWDDAARRVLQLASAQ